MLIQKRQQDREAVVVVEDDPTIGILIAAILTDEGYSPIVVRDGRRALQAVREIRPRVMTLDLELPGLDGRAVLRRLVDECAEQRPAIVVVSGSTEVLTREERRLVDRALTKPFDLVELVQAISAAAERAGP